MMLRLCSLHFSSTTCTSYRFLIAPGLAPVPPTDTAAPIHLVCSQLNPGYLLGMCWEKGGKTRTWEAGSVVVGSPYLGCAVIGWMPSPSRIQTASKESLSLLHMSKLSSISSACS